LHYPLLNLQKQKKKLTFLNYLDHDLLRRVTPLELVNQRWTKSGKDKNAPNVLAVIERFNQVFIYFFYSFGVLLFVVLLFVVVVLCDLLVRVL
jgi:hypothetical protein